MYPFKTVPLKVHISNKNICSAGKIGRDGLDMSIVTVLPQIQDKLLFFCFSVAEAVPKHSGFQTKKNDNYFVHDAHPSNVRTASVH